VKFSINHGKNLLHQDPTAISSTPDIIALKKAVRRQALARRDAMGDVERIEAGLAVADHVTSCLSFEPGTVISGFLPIRSEIDIRPLMARLAERGARLCVPAVVDRTTIEFRALVRGAVLVETGFGTIGPPPGTEVLDPHILLMPLSAFDTTGNRLGYGGGYYDRAIERLRRKTITPLLIGIAFACQRETCVPTEPHDRRLDWIVTEEGVIVPKQSGVVA
jgi:5-formyltetrahydrofolate cyclo-ligase